MNFQGTKAWRVLVAASITLLLAAIAMEFFFMDWFSAYVSVQTIEYVTLACTFLLITDIYLSFLKSSDKKAFLRKNALRILILLPWGTIFRALSFLKFEQFAARIPVLADLFAMEKAGSAAGKTILIAEKTKRLAEL